MEPSIPSISITPIVATIRYHPIGVYGDPYTFVCTLIKIDNVGYIEAGMGEYNNEIRKLIKVELLKCGITEVRFVRRKGQRKVNRQIKK